MTYQIGKHFDFAASHTLDNLPDGHPCRRLHGHNYTVEIILAGPLDKVGMVLDYRALAPFKAFIDDTLDHRHLNDIAYFAKGSVSPTAEALAHYLYLKADGLLGFVVKAVRVSETGKTWAEYGR